MNQNIKEAIDSLRVHHQLFPEYIEIEKGFDQVRNKIQIYKFYNFYIVKVFFKNFELTAGLIKLGHKLNCIDYFTNVQGIIKINNGILQANSDFRKG